MTEFKYLGLHSSLFFLVFFVFVLYELIKNLIKDTRQCRAGH